MDVNNSTSHLVRFFSNYRNGNDLSLNELINSVAFQMCILDRDFYLAAVIFLFSWIPDIPIAIWNRGKKAECGEDINKVNSKAAKQFIGNWIFHGTRAVSRWKWKTAFNSLSFLYRVATSTNWEKNVHLIFFLYLRPRTHRMNSKYDCVIDTSPDVHQWSESEL